MTDPPVIVTIDGGPAYLPRELAVAVTRTGRRIVVDHYGRHHHLEFSGRLAQLEGDRPVPVYRWLYSTAIAE